MPRSSRLVICISTAARRKLCNANRNGFFLPLDRATRKFLLAKPFSRVPGQARSGRRAAQVLPAAAESKEGTVVSLPRQVLRMACLLLLALRQVSLCFPVREQCDLFVGIPPAFIRPPYTARISAMKDPGARCARSIL